MAASHADAFVIIAEFTVMPDHFEAFKALCQEDAHLSATTEPGCRQFDVCVPEDAPNTVVLYEVYDDEAAFETHRRNAYVLQLVEAADRMTSGRVVRRLARQVR